MKRLSLLILLTLTSCNDPQFNQPASIDSSQPSYCTVERQEIGTVITCPDGSTSVIKDGAPGQSGSDGKDAPECSVTQIQPGDDVLPLGGAVINCGASSALISNGAAGATGLDGAQGEKGDKGNTGQNGTNGRDGIDAQPSAYSIVAILNPCSDSPSIDDEVFLKLANGTILWLQVDNENGKNARLSIARPGRWQTTDGSGCQFTLNADGSITNESFHN